MRNHIFLIIHYTDELMMLERVQRWISLTRVDTDDPRLLGVLDRKHSEIILRKVQIADEMFEISRSN